MRKLLVVALMAGGTAWTGTAQSRAASWPGLWGPSRDGESAAVAPMSVASAKELWRRRSAGGYAEVAVADGRAITMELRDGTDFVVALDAATGRERWAVRVGPTFKGHDGSADGPIATPAIDGDLVFAAGPHGAMVALDAATGSERWRHDLVREFGATVPAYGFAPSPLVEGGLVLITTGGPNSRGLLAFERVGLGPHLLVLGQTSGELRMVRASAEGCAELSRTRVFTPEVTSVTGPAIAGGTIYLRNLQEIAAFSPGA